MNESRFGILRALSIGLLLDATLACAGSDTPTVDENISDALRAGYASGRPVSRAGSGGDDNSGGSAGSSSTNAGSGGDDEPAGGSSGSGSGGTDAEGGEGGSAGEAEGGGGTAGSGEPTGCDGFAILQASCSGGGCHSAGSLSLFATSEDDAADFVGTESVNCSGQDIFIPATPSESLVIQKMRGTQSGCGGPMPPTGVTLPDADITCVEEWIGSL
jgi:hypothetical protein